MQIIEKVIDDIKLNYPLEKLSPCEQCLFIDIETTGFTARTSNLYLIGCVYFKDGVFKSVQFFADEYSEETEVIDRFFDFASDYKYLIHFNGNNFDIPYIAAKCMEHGLDHSFDSFDGIDIFRRISPYKSFLKIENCKQKTIEKFLKIDREDIYTGGDLIGIYHSYVSEKDPAKKDLLLLHNFEDIKGLVTILPILAYSDLFNEKVVVTKVSANYFNDLTNQRHSELLMTLNTPSDLPIPVSLTVDGCYFAAASGQAMLRVPLYEEELKYYYANYKEYYYLPAEDTALHKSVASFVDKSHRVQATADTCYTKKRSQFLPEWDAVVTPFFKKEYSSKNLFFELTNERKTDRELFSSYASHVLDHMKKLNK